MLFVNYYLQLQMTGKRHEHEGQIKANCIYIATVHGLDIHVVLQNQSINPFPHNDAF